MLRRTLRIAAPIAALCALSAPSLASTREQTLQILDSIRASNEALGLRAWVNDGSQSEIPLGEHVVYHFSAKGEAYLTAIHVDSHGIVNVLLPSRLWVDNRIGADRPLQLPPEESVVRLQAMPPIGIEALVVIATPAPLPPEALGLSLDASPLAQIDAPDAPAFAERLRRSVAALDPTTVAVARLEQRIVGRSQGPQYRSAEVVAFFTENTRGISRPRLDMHINFETNSDALSPEARVDLDEIGEALNQQSLQSRRFLISGHTDDVGPETYNFDLSRRRAESVYRYLVDSHDIAPDRLQIEARGESQPLELGTSLRARQMNRRVELELVR